MHSLSVWFGSLSMLILLYPASGPPKNMMVLVKAFAVLVVLKFLSTWKSTYIVREGNSFIHATYSANACMLLTGFLALPSHLLWMAVISTDTSRAASLSATRISLFGSHVPVLDYCVRGTDMHVNI